MWQQTKQELRAKKNDGYLVLICHWHWQWGHVRSGSSLLPGLKMQRREGPDSDSNLSWDALTQREDHDASGLGAPAAGSY
jgi:hypothetical protein